MIVASWMFLVRETAYSAALSDVSEKSIGTRNFFITTVEFNFLCNKKNIRRLENIYYSNKQKNKVKIK